MYMELARHNVACCNDQYFCYICRIMMSNSEDAWDHINGNVHWAREFNEKFHVSLETMTMRSKSFMQKLSNSNGTIVTSYSYFCVVCQENILDVMSILPHIGSRSHIENVKSRKNDDYVALMNDLKTTELKRKTDEIDIQPVLDANPNYKSNHKELYKYMYVELFKKLHNHSEGIFKVFVSNSIIIFESYNIKCPFCSCLIDIELALKHIKEHECQNASSVIPSDDDTLSLFKFEPEQCTELNENIIPDANEEGINEAKEIDLDETLSEEEIIAVASDTKQPKKSKTKFKCTYCGSSECYYKCSEEFQLTLNTNQINVTKRGSFRCKLCKGRRIKGVVNILNHIKSASHKQLKRNAFKESLKKELVIDCPNVIMKVNMNNQTNSLNGINCDVNHDVVPSIINTDEKVSIEVCTNGEKNDKMLNTNESGIIARKNTIKVIKEIDVAETLSEEQIIAAVSHSKKPSKSEFKCTYCASKECYYVCSEVFQQTLDANEITVTAYGRFICNLCKCRRIKGVSNILDHLRSTTHKQLKSNKLKKRLKKERVIDRPNVTMRVNLNQDVVPSTIDTDGIVSIEVDTNGETNGKALNTNESSIAGRSNAQVCKKKAEKSSLGVDTTTVTKGVDKIPINDENNSTESLVTKDINLQMLNINKMRSTTASNNTAKEIDTDETLPKQEIMAAVSGNKESGKSKFMCTYCNSLGCYYECSEQFQQTLVANEITVNEHGRFICNLCKCRRIKGVSNILIHIWSTSHEKSKSNKYKESLNRDERDIDSTNVTAKVNVNQPSSLNNSSCDVNRDVVPLTREKNDKVLNTNESGTAARNNTAKEKDVDEILSEEQIIAAVSDSMKPGIKSGFKCPYCGLERCYYICSEVFQRTLVANFINITKAGRFKCKLCKCRKMEGVPNILDHIVSTSHKQLKSNKIDSMITTDKTVPIGEKNGSVLNTNESGMTTAPNCTEACEKKSGKNSSGADITKITEGIGNMSVNDENDLIGSLITKDIKQHITKLLHIPPKRQTPEETPIKKLTLLEELNRPYTLKYLEIEEAMCNIQGQLNNIQISLRFVVPYSVLSKNFYCSLCNDPVSREIATLYEHLCLEKHEMEVNKIMNDSKSKKLSQQFMKENDNLVKCFACNLYQIVDTDKHIKTSSHKTNHKKFVKATDELFTYLSQSLCDMWYSIQQFGCALCKTNFKHKLDFLQHIVEKHSNICLKQMTFNFCIPCTTLWLSCTKNSYAEHCMGKIHKYLVKKQDFMIGDLPNSIENILRDADHISDTLLQYTKISSNDNVQDEIIKSLESSLRVTFPTVKAHVFGSRVAGLATVNSDVDIYVDCGNTYNQDTDEYMRKDHLTKIKQILSEDREEWWIKEMLTRVRVPLIKLVHKKTGLNCDISTTNGLSVEKTKLMRYLNDSYLPCRKLILFIKKWFYYFDLPARYGIISYALTWLVMFYLQTESYLPSVASLLERGKQEIRDSNRRPTVISGWEVDIAQPKNNNNNNAEQSTSSLLMGFFRFYADFDYRRNVICPLMGHTVLRTAFAAVDLPDEMGSYKWQLRMSKNPKYFRIDSPLCIQDPLELNENMTKAVSSITLNYFRLYCRKSAAVLQSSSE